MDEVAAEFFPKQSQFRSFERQLNGWEFQRLDSVAGKRSNWYHPHFVKEHPELLAHITRVTPSGKDSKLERAKNKVQHNTMRGKRMTPKFILKNGVISSAHANTMSHPWVPVQSDPHAAVVERDVDTMPQSFVDDGDNKKDDVDGNKADFCFSSLNPSNTVQPHRPDAHAAIAERNIASLPQPIEIDAEGDIDIDNDFLSFLDENDRIDTIGVQTVPFLTSEARHPSLKKSYIKCFPRGLRAVVDDAETMGHAFAISW